MNDYRNRYDRDGSCQKTGQGAHDRFGNLARKKGYDFKDASKEQDMKQHIDCFIVKNDKEISVDVKSMKKKGRVATGPDTEWIWIEYLNVKGDKGWLYGEEDVIAFEEPDGFCLVKREDLVELCEGKVPNCIETCLKEGKFALSKYDAEYKLYRRNGRKDLLTKIRMNDIKNNIKHVVWKDIMENKKEDKKWKIKDYRPEVEKELKEEHPLVARLMSQRDIPLDKMKDFLGAPYSALEDPHTLTGTEEAAKLFCDIALNKGSVSVMGDYDCDGVVSGTMIHELCKTFGLDCTVFLPSRLEHGYGLNEKSVKAYKEKVGEPSDLLIIVDCGSNNYDEIEELKKFGTKHIIIIDHHIMGDRTSSNADVLINWRASEHSEMCTTGQIYLFIRAIRKLTSKVDPIEFLTYAAIGTIGDVSPLIGDNRIIVKHGLQEDARNHIVASGLSALIYKSYISTSDIGLSDMSFKVVPKINASGRIQTPDLAMNLLIETDNDVADFLAEELTKYNEKRKTLQREIEKEAVKMVEENMDKFSHGIFVSAENWHVGIVGIIASRLVEKFDKPVLVIGCHNGLWKGSGRTVEGVNLKAVLDKCPEGMFDKYGGHEGAVGATVGDQPPDESCIENFNNACKEYFQEHEIKDSVKYYDAELRMETVSRDTAQLLIDRVYPYGDVNPEPIFLISDVKIKNMEMKEFKTTSKVSFDIEKDGITCPFKVEMFGPDFGLEKEGVLINLYFSFPQNIEEARFNSPSLDVKDIEFI